MAERRCARWRDGEDQLVAYNGGLWQVQCWGTLRTLYTRDVVDGRARGWQDVGTVCLRCGDVQLQRQRLPKDTSTLTHGWMRRVRDLPESYSVSGKE